MKNEIERRAYIAGFTNNHKFAFFDIESKDVDRIYTEYLISEDKYNAEKKDKGQKAIDKIRKLSQKCPE